MMLPILISVAVAPVSYFFCASAPLLETASRAIAAEKTARRMAITGITCLPSFFDACGLLRGRLFFRTAGFVAFCRGGDNKKPPVIAALGASFSRTSESYGCVL